MTPLEFNTINMKNKGCLIGVGLLLLILTGALIYYFYVQNSTDPVKYESVQPEVRDVLKKAVATGSIKPRREINIKPQVSGVVEQLFVEEGAMVKKGQKLAKIKLIPSQVNINSAQSNVELARIRMKEAEREFDRQTNLNSQNLDVDQAKVAYDLAQREKERNRQLLEDGVISESEYTQFQLDFELKKSQFENIKISSQNSIKQFATELDIRRQELEASINNLQLLQEGATKNSKQVSNIIVSTVNGMVLDIPVEEGSSVIERNTFNEGTSVATVADMSNLIFEGKVDESDVGKLQEGMPLVVTVGAVVDTTFKAALEFISPKGVDEEGTVKFEIKAAITDIPEGVFLRAGYSANADVILERKDQVVSVQERDIIYSGDTTFVEIKRGDQEYDKIEIETGISDGLYTEVLNGIDTTSHIKKQTDPNAQNIDEDEG
jgi:HlyD family secretion protein